MFKGILNEYSSKRLNFKIIKAALDKNVIKKIPKNQIAYNENYCGKKIIKRTFTWADVICFRGSYYKMNSLIFEEITDEIMQAIMAENIKLFHLDVSHIELQKELLPKDKFVNEVSCRIKNNLEKLTDSGMLFLLEKDDFSFSLREYISQTILMDDDLIKSYLTSDKFDRYKFLSWTYEIIKKSFIFKKEIEFLEIQISDKNKYNQEISDLSLKTVLNENMYNWLMNKLIEESLIDSNFKILPQKLKGFKELKFASALGYLIDKNKSVYVKSDYESLLTDSLICKTITSTFKFSGKYKKGLSAASYSNHKLNTFNLYPEDQHLDLLHFIDKPYL